MGLGLYFLKMPVNLCQYHGTVGLFNSRSIVNRSKVNNFINSNYRNNTFIACSLISVNKILLLLLFSVLSFIKDNVSKNNRQFLVSILFSSTISLIPFAFFFFSLLVSLNGDIEANLGPNHKSNEALSICHWNLDSISAHNFAKLHLLKAYVTVHKFNIICFSETYLDSSILVDDDNLEISGYNLIHLGHPSNSKHGGVCIYYKNVLPLGNCD